MRARLARCTIGKNILLLPVRNMQHSDDLEDSPQVQESIIRRMTRLAIRLLDMEDGFYQRIKRSYEAKKETLLMALRGVGFRVTSPQGAYYLFANYRQVPGLETLSPMEAAMHLIKERGVAAVPGDNFYNGDPTGNNYLRFAFCRNLNTLQEAAQRLSALGDVSK